MTTKIRSSSLLTFFGRIKLILFTLITTNTALAASLSDSSSSGIWDLIIIFVVIAVTLASAVLPAAAIRQWDRNWRLVAGLPLFILLAWLLIIVITKSLNPESHQLWPLEIFAWAMINMIYMVTVMTAKRMFAKKDSEDALKP